MIQFRGSFRPVIERSERGQLTVATLVLGLLTLFLERYRFPYDRIIIPGLDFLVLGLILVELAIRTARASSVRAFLSAHWFDTLFLAVYIPVFVYAKRLAFTTDLEYARLPAVAVVLRSAAMLLRLYSRLRRMAGFLRGITNRPARTVTVSFAAVIVAGTIFLMQPFATADQQGLAVLNALFTSTSAVCVTGLIVVDTATVFTFWGWLIILALIQIGGLGIMILSYFAAFAFRRRLSVEDKLLISYMLSEKDMSGLRNSVRRIVLISLAIEGVGAALLAIRFSSTLPVGQSPIFFAIFHSVSAFCNAGFSLFSDSLMSFRSDLLVNVVVCVLIILGGLSFAVIINITRVTAASWVRGRRDRLTVNTKVVLVGTAVLLLAGVVLFYAIEHRHVLADLGLGSQYLAALFQSVTLRTAGFNTLDFSKLRIPTYTLMILFMFVGGAAGSTAGGIKVNVVAVIGAHLRAVLRDRKQVVLTLRSVSPELVTKAYTVLVFGIAAVSGGAFLLTLTEKAPLEHILFETVSAFATVGLSAGLTGDLTGLGRVVVIVLMFMGRLGPLTLLAAAATPDDTGVVRYPEADIVVG